MERLVGYARVSTNEQNLDLQINSLIESGCHESQIFSDKVSGAKSGRPGLDQCLQNLESGDTLVVWRLDRLGRSMAHLIQLVEDLRQQGIGFKSICDGAIDTTTASGELIFNIFSSLAQFERRLIQERTRAGLTAARARGKQGGRRLLLVRWGIVTRKIIKINHLNKYYDVKRPRKENHPRLLRTAF